MTNKWYIINVVAGQENKICEDINLMAKENEYIKEAFTPTKNVLKSATSKRKKMETVQKLLPNYVFVNMEMNKDSYADIRSIPKVLRFLGSKLKPEEVPENEMKKMMNKIDEENTSSQKSIYEVGDIVKIVDGPFESFTGTVESRDVEKNILKISISIFGRPTVIEIESNKVEKV